MLYSSATLTQYRETHMIAMQIDGLSVQVLYLAVN